MDHYGIFRWRFSPGFGKYMSKLPIKDQFEETHFFHSENAFMYLNSYVMITKLMSPSHICASSWNQVL